MTKRLVKTSSSEIQSILNSLENDNKIEILGDLKFKSLKSNIVFEITKCNDDQCECGKQCDYTVYEDDMNMSVTPCKDCLIYSLNNYDDCGWDD